MKNSPDKIGERIRLERLKHNLTQSQLSGDVITRNMLSLIESGAALPYVETLIHIANTLDIPAGVFFADDEKEEALYTKIQTASKAKSLFASGKYEECADLCKTVLFDDELTFLAAECELRQAENEMKSLTLKSAAERLETALSVSSKSVYISKDFEGTVKSYLYFIKCAASEIDTEEIGRLSKLPSRIPASAYSFMTLLSLLDKGKLEEAQTFAASFPFMTVNEAAYFKGAVLMRTMKTAKAGEVLRELYEKEELSFILKYRICADLECCAEMRRDYESAYAYSREKHRMTELFDK